MKNPLKIREVKISRILNPTSIDLGEAVINPYKGCELGCVYCYVRTNRSSLSNPDAWGSYVDIRINAPDQLSKELTQKKISTVLLGSTTECFQPVEKKYGLTKKTLDILNEHRISYVILTRSTAILEALPHLRKDLCKKIYFTVNLFNQKFKQVLEPKSPDFTARAKAIDVLLNEGLKVTAYFSPVLPWISDHEKAFETFSKVREIEFEFLNFKLNPIHEIIRKIASIDPKIGKRYQEMQTDKDFFIKVWEDIENNIESAARGTGNSFKIYKHSFEGFFENRYDDVKI